MTSANISYFKFKFMKTSSSPNALTDIEEVFSVSGVGQTNQLVNVTNFDSPAGTQEFIAGLAEGDEITVEANYVPGATMQTQVMADVGTGSSRSAKLVYTASSPNRSWSFTAVCLGYKIVPSPTERNTIQFAFKISGTITRV